VEDFLREWGSWAYLIIMAWTFLEGETVVIVAGVLASQGLMDVWLILLFALTGSFCGDQMYFYIGRRYGTPLLERWPTMQGKIDWAFRFLRRYETAFILSFRFIYGIRNVSPFVIGIAGVSRLRFFVLNLIAAILWAGSFSFGGYFLGDAMEKYLGKYQYHALGGFVAVAAAFGLYSWMRNRSQLRELAAKQEMEAAASSEAAVRVPESQASE
jgi:membrane protein DedA with SNARE-associated domain